MLQPTVTSSVNGVTSHHIGIIDFKVIAATGDTDGSFSLGEFSGGEGTWTVPHVHATCIEAFYVLDGRFTFTLGRDEYEATPGSFVLVPRNVRHLMRAEAGGGRFLTLWTPGGLEAMFVELGRLAPGAILDPEVRKAISARYDSIPV